MTCLHARWLMCAPDFEAVEGPVEIVLGGQTIESINAADTALDRLAMPPLVNAHDHGYGLRTLDIGAPDDALECWIPGLLLRPDTNPELEAAVAFGRMALSGIGTTVHCHNSGRRDRIAGEADAVARAAAKVGIRVAFSCPIADRNPHVYGDPIRLEALGYPKDWLARPGAGPDGKEQIANAVAIHEAHHSERFNVQLGPIGPQWVADETMEGIAEISTARNMRIHMHLLETERQRHWLDETYPEGPVARLDRIGLLSPRLTVAHGVWLRPDEAELLAMRGVTVAVNTSSNLRLRSGIAPAADLDAAGVLLGIGLDGSGLDDDQDHFREMRLFKHMQSGMALDDRMPAARALAHATRGGYRVFDGSEDYGRLEAGARADVLVLDMVRIQGQQTARGLPPMALLMARASAADVRSLFVDGHEVVRDGRLVGFDFDAAVRDLAAEARRAGGRDRIAPDDLRRAIEALRSFYRRRPDAG